MKRVALIFAILLLAVTFAHAQPRESDLILQQMDRQGCVEVDSGKIKICKFDYESDGSPVEAISFRPVSSPGKVPGVLLIPGYQRTARDQLYLGMDLARAGFAAAAVTQPGFGGSRGKADYVGPGTIKALTKGYLRLKSEPYVDAQKMGVYGYSRGGMAASLLAVKLDDVRAAVLGAGIYDFKRAHDEVKIEGIRKNMEAETGMTAEAIRERSSVFQMKNLKCPVLILHGEKDENVPVSQAILLRDELTRLKKEFEIKLYPDKAHSIGAQEVTVATIEFFKRTLLTPSGK